MLMKSRHIFKIFTFFNIFSILHQKWDFSSKITFFMWLWRNVKQRVVELKIWLSNQKTSILSYNFVYVHDMGGRAVVHVETAPPPVIVSIWSGTCECFLWFTRPCFVLHTLRHVSHVNVIERYSYAQQKTRYIKIFPVDSFIGIRRKKEFQVFCENRKDWSIHSTNFAYKWVNKHLCG